MKKLLFITVILGSSFLTAISQLNNPGSNHANRFEDLNYLLATPNEYRTASGAPGQNTWQKKAANDIPVELNEQNNVLKGTKTVTNLKNFPNQ